MRTLPLLLVDLGNTNVGVALLAEHGADACIFGNGELGDGALDDGGGGARAPFELARVSFAVAGLAEAGGGFDVYVADVAATMDTVAAKNASRVRAYVSSVQRPAVAAEVDDVLRRHGLVPARVNAPSGLALALQSPETCGFDRQYAARAALARSGGPALVVSAGTALTVDAVVPWGDARGHAALAQLGVAVAQGLTPAGVFLGGAIAPGPRLLVDALARGGARLFGVDGLDADVPALGRDSASALRAGVVHGFRGAARELVERLGAETGLAGAPIWLTGGAAPLLREAFSGSFGARLAEAPGLVLEGLARAAQVAGSAAGEATR